MATLNTVAPTADDVRSWAKSRGIDVAEHGRLPFDVVSAFNKGRKVGYESTMKQPAKLLRVEGKKAGKNGRNVRAVYHVTVADLRQWAIDNGLTVTDRGRIPAEVIAAYGTREAAPLVKSETGSVELRGRKGR
jgi:hypothetical protein